MLTGFGVTVIEKFTDPGGGSAVTTCISTADVLAAVAVSPLALAVMLWLPAVSAAVANVATPNPFSTPVPIAVPLSRNVTVPVATGVEAPLASPTVAVNVTLSPTYDGFTLDISVVVVANTGVIVSLNTGDADPLKSKSPPYTTVIGSVPTGSAEVVSVAVLLTPLAFAANDAVPITVVPSRKVTVPLGGTYSPTNVTADASDPITVAVNVTGRPCGDVLGEPTTVAVVVSGVTVSVTGLEVDVECTGSPTGEYTPVNTCVPTCAPVPTVGGHDPAVDTTSVHSNVATPLYVS
jgi:hypothetical protein